VEKLVEASGTEDPCNVQALAAGALCIFGGHKALTFKRHPGSGKVGDGEGAADSGVVVGGASHSCAGLLSAPKEGPGLALTLGPMLGLDATHTVIGPVIIGRNALRRINALASLSGGCEPRKSLAVFHAAKEHFDAEGDAAIVKTSNQVGGASVHVDHPFLLLGVGSGAADKPFSLEEPKEAPASEVIDIIELELNVRDVEIQELRAMAFNRERAQGVSAVELDLSRIQGQLTGFENLDTASGHQRDWQHERARHLQRILSKLM